MNILDATNKIARIAQKKFGCNIHFTRLTSLTGEKPDLDVSVIERNFGAQFIIANNDILIPVYVQHDLFGIIKLEGAANLDTLRLQTLQDFAESTLKEFIIKDETLRRTRIMESSLEAQKICDNVVPIYRTSQQDAMISFQRKLNGEIEEAGTTIGHIGLLHASNSKAHKIAIDLHDVLDRRGFLPFLDLNWNKETFTEELLALGRSTLFVSEVAKLNFEQQNMIVQFLRQYHVFSSPLFIFASELTYEKLVNNGQIMTELLDILSHNSIDASMIEFASKSELKDYFHNLLKIN